MTDAPQTSMWAKVWAWVRKWILAPLPMIIIVVVAILLVMLGVKNLQIGGLLGKLTGKEAAKGKKAVEVANSIPKDRIDKNGNLIPPGTPDDKGVTQAKVVPIERPGLFDRDDQVKILPPDAKEPIVVDLPEGVTAKDVDKVIIVKPQVYAVTVKDNSGVSSKDVDDLLAKYGK